MPIHSTNRMNMEQRADLGFSFRLRKSGDVEIHRQGAVVTVLAGAAAGDFVRKVQATDAAGAQQLMARVTGDYKRGNERTASRHARRG